MELEMGFLQDVIISLPSDILVIHFPELSCWIFLPGFVYLVTSTTSLWISASDSQSSMNNAYWFLTTCTTSPMLP